MSLALSETPKTGFLATRPIYYYSFCRYLDKKLVWEDIKEEDVNIEELDEMFSKTALLSSKRFSPLKPKAKAKEVKI